MTPPSGSHHPAGFKAFRPNTPDGKLDLDAINSAAGLFNFDFGRPPRDLQELFQQKYFTVMPSLPLGQRLVMEPRTGKFKLASQ